MLEQNNRETIYITCCDCGDEFPFEPGEQLYFQRHFLNLPRRCAPCRLARKINLLQKQTPSWAVGKGEVVE